MKPALLTMLVVSLPMHGMFINKNSHVKKLNRYCRQYTYNSNSSYNALTQKITALPISDEHRRYLQEQADSHDRSAKKYINFVCSLPWNKTTKDTLNITQARKILDDEHYALEAVKERILEFVAIKTLNRQSRYLNALCLIGKPGIGKTSIAKSTAKIFNRKSQVVGLGGVSNTMHIKGSERGWTGAIPGRIIQAIQLAQSKNPIIVLDEIDKVSQSSHNGNPAAALLEVLDPQQNIIMLRSRLIFHKFFLLQRQTIKTRFPKNY